MGLDYGEGGDGGDGGDDVDGVGGGPPEGDGLWVSHDVPTYVHLS